jgi:hypothetical protein
VGLLTFPHFAESPALNSATIEQKGRSLLSVLDFSEINPEIEAVWGSFGVLSPGVAL